MVGLIEHALARLRCWLRGTHEPRRCSVTGGHRCLQCGAPGADLADMGLIDAQARPDAPRRGLMSWRWLYGERDRDRRRGIV